MKEDRENWNKCNSCGSGIPPGLNMSFICPECLIKPHTKKQK